MYGEPCFQCGIKTWTIHHCPGLGPWWKNNGWVRKSELASYEFAKEREQKRQDEARPVTYRALPVEADNFFRSEAATLSEMVTSRREPTLHELMLQSVIHWKPF